MKATIRGSNLRGTIGSVPSKSYAHRALICAALSDKPTKIMLPLSNEDIDTTIDCLKAMGAAIQRDMECLFVTPVCNPPACAELNCRESGSTLRFLLPVAASILKQADFTGTGRLPERPIGELQKTMKQNGAVFSDINLPFSVSGKLSPGTYNISGDISSQYISGLLMALPLLNGNSEIVLTSPLCSAPYVDVTIDTLSKFGIVIEKTENGFSVNGRQVYHSPETFSVEGDWSSAAIILAGGAIGGDVTVSNIYLDSKQGDKKIVEILQRFGAEIFVSGNSVTVKSATMKACDIDVSLIPDLFPILAVLAANAEGKTILYNASNLRLKESDRIKSTAELINSLGGNAVQYPDRLEIEGTKLKGGKVDSFGDHRIVMSAAIAASICEDETTIRGAGAVSKSYPKFFTDYAALGGKVIISESGEGMELEKVRAEIDEIDDKLLSLFLRRMELGKNAMLEKKQSGKPIKDKLREREILKNISDKSGDMSVYSRRLVKELISLSRSYQGSIKESETLLSKRIKASEITDVTFPKVVSIACQGIEGANSQIAADRLFPQGNIMYFKSIDGVCNAVKSGLCDYGVLPVDNSLYGSVHDVYNILKNGDLSIIRSVKLCIRHELLAKPNTKLSDIKEIISHEQALGQCGGFLKKLEDKVKTSSCENTAMAAKIASENEGVAAISSPNCAELYGLLPVTGESIQDSDNNYTRFVCISAKPEIYPGANRISFMASCRHEPGELYRLVSVIDAMDVNITKLESKPIVGRDFEFMFFLDIEASVLEPGIIGMLEEIERSSESFVFLGNYQEI